MSAGVVHTVRAAWPPWKVLLRVAGMPDAGLRTPLPGGGAFLRLS